MSYTKLYPVSIVIMFLIPMPSVFSKLLISVILQKNKYNVGKNVFEKMFLIAKCERREVHCNMHVWITHHFHLFDPDMAFDSTLHCCQVLNMSLLCV